MKCPKCSVFVFGENQSFCKSCLHTFGSGGDRWFSLEDENSPFSSLD